MPKIVDHDKKRAELLEQSFALFAQRGYNAISMRHIADELKISTGTLYHYFPNKEALFSQMFDWLSQHDIVRVTQDVHDGLSVEQKLTILLRFISSNIEHFQTLVLMALEFHKHPNTPKEDIQRSLENYRQAIQEHFAFENPTMANLLLGTLLGVLLQTIFSPSENLFEEYKQFLLSSSMVHAILPA